MTPSVRSKTKPKPNEPTTSWEFDAIGTSWWIGIFEPIAHQELADLQRRIAARIEDFDKTYSRFRADSLVTQISKQAGTYTFPADSVKLFNFYRQLYEATKGSVTPLVGDVLAAAGYDATYSLKPGKLSQPLAWDDALSIKGRKLTATQPVLLDFGAAGKGYLVDQISDILQAAGIQNCCVDAGGDMRVCGDETLRIGLENPDNTTQVIGVARLKDRALCGSAGNRRAWGEYHHIMDPFSLRPARGIKAAWVAADDTMTADGLATALFFVSPGQLERFNFDYLLVNARDGYASSEGFPAELFTESDD